MIDHGHSSLTSSPSSPAQCLLESSDMSPLPDGDNKPSDDGLLVQTLVSGSTTSQSRPSPGRKPWLQALYHKLTFTPPRCRHDPTRPFKFSMGLNVLFGMLLTACLPPYHPHRLTCPFHLLQPLQDVSPSPTCTIPTPSYTSWLKSSMSPASRLPTSQLWPRLDTLQDCYSCVPWETW